MWLRLVMLSLAFLAVGAPVRAAPGPLVKSVFLNGVNIDGVTQQRFENATVVIDEKGNILISVKGYEVKAVAEPVAVLEKKPATEKYFVVGEVNGPGLAQYDLDVFVNAVWVKRISSTDTQSVFEISKYLHQGKNQVHIAATKVIGEARRSSSPQHYVKLYVGVGAQAGNNIVLEDTVFEYRRDASEMQNFSNDFTVVAN